MTPEMAATPEPQTVIEAAGDAETQAAAKINAALASPTEIVCKEMPLHVLIDELKARHKIEIQIDVAGLKDAGLDANSPITKNIKGVSLRSALRLLLDELQLKYAIHNEVLLITSPEKAESDDFLATKIYPVKDLVLVRNETGEIEADFQPLIDLIQNTVACKSWLDNGGNGPIASYQFQGRCLLVISQTQEVHEQVADLLAALRRCAPADAKELRLPQRPKTVVPGCKVIPATPAPAAAAAPAASTPAAAPAQSPAASSSFAPNEPVRILTPEMAATPQPKETVDTRPSQAEPKIKAALAQPTSIEFVETPLQDVVDYLKDVHKIEIQLDSVGLKDAEIDESASVTKNIKGVSLRSALRLLLDELGLKCVIHNDVLLITSPQKVESDEFMSTKIYPVKDLVLVRNDREEIETDFRQLIDVFQNTVNCRSWDENGGPGTIAAYQFQDRCLLVVRQTQKRPRGNRRLARGAAAMCCA